MSWVYWVPVALAGLCGLLYTYQHRLLYFPDVPLGHRTTMMDPVTYGLPAPESVMLPMRDGVRLHLWLFVHVHGKAKATVVFLHGNAGNISFRSDNFRGLYREADANVVAVEYRGYGLSEGTPGEAAIRADMEEVLAWLRARDDIDVARLFLLGRSLGGAVAVQLAATHQHQLAGLILENTFTSTSDMVDLIMPQLRYFKWLSRNHWGTLETVPRLTLPCLFVSSGRDELVPASMMPLLFERYAGAKERLHIAAGQHMNAHTFPDYLPRIKRFLAAQ